MSEFPRFSDGRPVPDFPGFETTIHMTELDETVALLTTMTNLQIDDARFCAEVLIEGLEKLNQQRATP